MATLAAQQTQLTAQKRLQAAADSASTLARQRYKEGVTTYLEVIEADHSQVAGHLQAAATLIALAVGGGVELPDQPVAEGEVSAPCTLSPVEARVFTALDSEGRTVDEGLRDKLETQYRPGVERSLVQLRGLDVRVEGRRAIGGGPLCRSFIKTRSNALMPAPLPS